MTAGSNDREQRSPLRARPSARGKFLFAGNDKLYVRGATYGTFHRGPGGDLYPSPSVVARDFREMAANGFNAVRTYTAPPRWLLDVAAENELLVMVGIAWEQHVDFLEERRRARSIEYRVRAGVAACAGHPALLSYSIGNEIPSQIVRWLGRGRVERFIARLYRAAKAEDPGGLVSYVNYPPTEYLQLPFLDFMCFNVYLEARPALDAYLARLHNITGDRPLVMAEIGLDSRTHGELAQADALGWQIRTAFSSGCAGAFVFAWTDDWYVSFLSEMAAADGMEIDDWDFGLTRRDRRPKPALGAVRRAFEETPFESARTWPKVSVVVCTFNGEKTIGECLEGLERLDYPDFEVIVVNDGSTDSTPTIASKGEVRLINLERAGLAAARNIGLEAATGEIVAYLDDDARPDPHWLGYLVAALERSPYAGVGGPNVPPAGSSIVASCLADAPGSPIHVLTSDREAEHIPGCNMAFRKQALEAVGGFDPQFRIAGDDVDLCWRLLEARYRLGFSAAAVVWHRPRETIRAYWRQQRGYGRAEAMLERKWPGKYRAGGRARWAGRLYGRALQGLGRWRVYYGTWGAELFQSLYAPDGGDASSLLGTPGWYLWGAALALMSVAGLAWSPLFVAVPLLLVTLLVSIVLSGASAARSRSVAQPLTRRARATSWALTTFLYLLQPLARLHGRIGTQRRSLRPAPRRIASPIPRAFKVWTEAWQPGEMRLSEMEARLRAGGAIVARGGVYDRWDLQVRHSFMSAVRIRVGIEEHGAGRQLVRVQLTPCYARDVLAVAAMLAVVSLLGVIEGADLAAVVLGVPAVTIGAYALGSAGLAMGSVLHESQHGVLSLRREVANLKLEAT
jgi:GT2 family glycosyltransferase